MRKSNFIYNFFRLFDTIKFNSNKFLIKKNSENEKDKNETIDPSNINPIIIKTTSPISPINIRNNSKDNNPEVPKDSPTLTPNLNIVNSKRKSSPNLNFRYDKN